MATNSPYQLLDFVDDSFKGLPNETGTCSSTNSPQFTSVLIY